VSSVRSVTVRQLIPEGLAQMAPGPQLGVLLAGLDMSALTGTDLVEVLRARVRQLSHDQAQLLAAMVEAGLCDPQCRLPRVSLRRDSPDAAARGLHRPGHRGGEAAGFEPTPAREPSPAFEVCDGHLSTDRPGCSSKSTRRSGPRRTPANTGERGRMPPELPRGEPLHPLVWRLRHRASDAASRRP
jgi:hypothetical protein